MAACGLLLTGYAAFLELPWAVLGVTAAVAVIPLWVLVNAGDAHAHGGATPTAPTEQRSAAPPPVALDPAWAKVVTSWGYMGFLLPAILIPAGFLMIHAGWWGAPRTAARYFYWLPHILATTGAAVFFGMFHAIEERHGTRLKGVSLLNVTRMFRAEKNAHLRRALAWYLLGAALFLPGVGWALIGAGPYLYTLSVYPR